MVCLDFRKLTMARPKTKSKGLRRFYDLFEGPDRVLIVIDPDPDAIASAQAVKRLLWRKVASTAIATIRPIRRLNNLTMVRLLRVPLLSHSSIDKKDFSKFILVDGQPHFNETFASFRFNLVIDHHPLTREVDADVKDIRPNYGSTSTILTEYLKSAKIKPSATLATGLVYGIKTDTKNFESNAVMEDVMAFRHLFPYINSNVLHKIEISDMKRADLRYFFDALNSYKIRKDKVSAHLEKCPSPDILVLVADFFLKIHEVGWIMVSGVCGKNLFVILRNDGVRKNAGRVAAKAFGDMGRAGGHKAMARAELPLENVLPHLDDDDPDELGRFVRRRFFSSLR